MFSNRSIEKHFMKKNIVTFSSILWEDGVDEGTRSGKIYLEEIFVLTYIIMK